MTDPKTKKYILMTIAILLGMVDSFLLGQIVGSAGMLNDSRVKDTEVASANYEQEDKVSLGLPSPMPPSEGRSDDFTSYEEYLEALPSDRPVSVRAAQRFADIVGIPVGNFVITMTESAEAKNPAMCDLFDNLCVEACIAGTSPAELRADPEPMISHLLSLNDKKMQEVAKQLAAAKAIAGPKDPIASNNTGINIPSVSINAGGGI